VSEEVEILILVVVEWVGKDSPVGLAGGNCSEVGWCLVEGFAGLVR